MRRLSNILPGLALAALLWGSAACGAVSFGLELRPRYYLDGLPFNAVPFNGYWHDGYVYWQGLWYYHGHGTPYDWDWYGSPVFVDGDWRDGYVYWQGLWYYHGIGTPYDWYWYD